MVPEQPPEEHEVESPFGEEHCRGDDGQPSDAGCDHRVDRRARAVGEQGARAQQRIPRMWTDRREHGVMAGHRGGHRVRLPRVAARDTDPDHLWKLVGRADERRHLVPSRAGEIEDLPARSSVRANHEESHTPKTG